ncbi:Homeodomain-like domain-containing protein [Persephonella hydrogeniphila]|uniref:Homeodomain-like domain-containing protein n=1 Tax=Persephonella hydrogeniphila TaxID=198703 RepID=A0A285NFH7_9AQUI|nr:helix-turn-helix domain-containing protein [Persephonella hydrogeniphila]SNZ08264.1 Homeodomain-like domain-containing protein [Persephonella hydrogeniphila]
MKEQVEKLTLKHRRPDVYNLLKELGCEYIGVEEVPIEKIMIDQGIYPREKTDKERVSLYASNILDGDVFPPILTSADYTKLDGNHRYYAHKEAGKTTIWIEKWEVPQGLYPVVAQAVNTEEKTTDTPLTIGEKKRAILRDWELLNHYDKKTRKIIISKALKVSISYVNKVLSQAGIIKSEKEELREKVKELSDQGLNQTEIARKLGINQATVSRILKDYAKITRVKNAYPDKPHETEEYDGSWNDWNEEDEEETQEEPLKAEKISSPKKKEEKEKKLLHPNQILERCKTEIWDAVIEIEFRLGEDKALEVLEEIYFAYKERKHKGLTIYKDIRARYDAFEK